MLDSADESSQHRDYPPSTFSTPLLTFLLTVRTVLPDRTEVLRGYGLSVLISNSSLVFVLSVPTVTGWNTPPWDFAASASCARVAGCGLSMSWSAGRCIRYS